MHITTLRTNYRKNPEVVDMGDVFFSWNIESGEQNVYQDNYRIEVWKENGEKTWDSGRISGNDMLHILYKGEELEEETRYNWRVTVECRMDGKVEKNKRIVAVSEMAFFATGINKKEDWLGSFIGETRDKEYHVYRKTFQCQGAVKRAKIYLCGLGHFEIYINGNKISDYVLEPAWSDYNKTCYYTAYDVTAQLREGKNAALVKLGDGMFHVPGGRYVYYERSYGKSKFIAKMVIEYEDGRKEAVVTDRTWKKKKSPILFCCIYGGEEYDSRLWNQEMLLPEYKEMEEWSAAECVPFPKGTLKAQQTEPLKVMQRYEPVRVIKTQSGAWLYDFGTNFSGWARIKIRSNKKQAGQKVIMTPGEILSPNHLPDQKVTGVGYSWDYILNEEEIQEFAPDFTYTGFRYLAVTGAAPEGGVLPEIISVTGEYIYPDLKNAGEFNCSNDLFNRIHGIIRQAILSNTKSYFTDCPHREKLGWLEQTHLIGPSIMYNLEVQALYSKIEADMCDAQRENGLVPDICPEYVTGFDKYHEGFVDSPEWGSALIINTWYVYKRYGDTLLFQKYYENMKWYLSHLTQMTHHHVLHHGLGDWLDIGPMTPHSQNTPVPVIATCIYYYDLTIMYQIAKELGKKEDAKKYAALSKDVYREYNLQFLDNQTGRYATGSQAAQAMSLMVGLVPEKMKDKVIKQLEQDIVKRNYTITAGDVGHPFLVRTLMKYGMEDVLNEMLLITKEPGYGYQVVNGATTLTEEWDGPDPNRPHGSQNHLMLGSIEEWFYGSLGGIELIRTERKVDEIMIRPFFAKGIEWVKVWVAHPYGKVKTSWRIIGEIAEVSVVIPPCTTAYLEDSAGNIIKKVGSGTYTYQIPYNKME